jgi:hypothetical protein
VVRYRLGHPAFAAWLDATGPYSAQSFAVHAAEAVGTAMEAYRPVVVFLRALVPDGG